MCGIIGPGPVKEQGDKSFGRKYTCCLSARQHTGQISSIHFLFYFTRYPLFSTYSNNYLFQYLKFAFSSIRMSYG